MYHSGRGVPRDEVLAYMWMLLAARGGDAQAQAGRELAVHRLNDEQVARANDMARRWQAAHGERRHACDSN